MGLLLDLAYSIAAAVASPWLAYRLFVRGDRRDLRARAGADLGARLERSIWLHGSSAGEIALLRPLIELIEKDMPSTPLLISAYSATGLIAARKAYPRHRVILFPLDFSFVVNRFLDHFDPRLIVIVESEFWPNFLLRADKRSIPVAVLNGKMSPKSYRKYAWTRLVPALLRRLPLIAVQSEEHAERLERLGVPKRSIRVTGNMKYDLARPLERPARYRELRESLGFHPADVVLIGGSLHEREDEVLLEAAARLDAAACMIIVPRYPADAARVEESVRARGLRSVRKSAVDAGRASAPGREGVLIVDTVGELGALYGVADVAFVGGSLFYRGSNKGGHNLMEPAILGIPVLFGPYNFSFKDTVRDLLAAGGGILVRDTDELAQALAMLVADPEGRRRIGASARQVVLEGQGATRRNYALLLPMLDADRGRLPGMSFERTMPRPAGDLDSR